MASSNKKLIRLSYGPCEAMKLKIGMGTGRVYIRPLQQNFNLEVEPTNMESNHKENCIQCGKSVLLCEMERHIKDNHSTSDNNLHDDEIVELTDVMKPGGSADEVTEIPDDAGQADMDINLVEDLPIDSQLIAGTSSVINTPSDAISGHPNDDFSAVIDGILENMERTINSEHEEPCSILREYQSLFLQGRQLDANVDMFVEEGDVSSVFISRLNAMETATEECVNIENIRHPLCVTFYGESAVDTGGPRRDFFRVFIKDIVQKNILKEEDQHMVVGMNDSLLHGNYYFVSGLVIGLSTLEGGDVLHLKEDILTTESNMPHMRKFQHGLKKCGIMQLVRQYPLVKYIWTNPANRTVTIGRMLSALTPNFSPQGGSSRTEEEKAYQIFTSYLREVAGQGRKDFPSLTIRSILAYITGNSTFPVLGFSPPASIEFVAKDKSFLPRAHTCINQLVLVKVPFQTDEAVVKNCFDWAFSSMDFGAENVF